MKSKHDSAGRIIDFLEKSVGHFLASDWNGVSKRDQKSRYILAGSPSVNLACTVAITLWLCVTLGIILSKFVQKLSYIPPIVNGL